MNAASPHDGRRASAAAERNRDPILGVLRQLLPSAGLVLEIASGTGQHVVHFAAALPALEWQPSDPDPASHASIRAWVDHFALANVRAPIALDVRMTQWPIAQADAVLAINMIHIAPWEATAALFAGAARLLPVHGVLFLYGPFKRHGEHTAPSNAAFDRQLRSQDPAWGVRDLEAVADAGRRHGFEQADLVAMPANNFSVVFRRSSMPRA